jgi:hypothetical protein
MIARQQQHEPRPTITALSDAANKQMLVWVEVSVECVDK